MSDADWDTGSSDDSWSSDGETSDEGLGATMVESASEAADQAYCYVSSAWAVPNVTIYAPSQSEADKKAPSGTTYCHDGPCTYEGKFEPLEEGCG